MTELNRRAGLKMKKELVVIAALLVAAMFTVLPLSANAQIATVFIDAPDTVDISVGTFNVKVNISDVVGLYGWEFKLYYPKALMNFTTYTTVGHFLESGGQTFQVDKSNRDFNETHGLIHLADSLLGAPAGVDGSGALVTLTFEALSEGTVELIFEDLLPAMPDKNIKLGDKSANQIENIAVDKTFDIIPEFTFALLLLAILTASTVVVALTKKQKR